MSDLSALEYLSKIQDLVDLNDFMDDQDFADACDLALKCIAKPDLPPAAAKKALVQMQGYAFKFKMMGLAFMTIKKGKAGTPENAKKNVYYSVSEQCDSMAQSLKYLVKEQF